MRHVWIELFSGQGGSAMGLHRAGFEVICVDINPQPRNPFEFIQADAMDLDLPALVRKTGAVGVGGGPPCQGYTRCQKIQGRLHPKLIAPLRVKLRALGVVYLIENVEEARPHLIDPVMLCGAMFPELRTYRHRLFESNVPLIVPDEPEHVAPLRKMGRPPQPGEFMHVVGNYSGAEYAKAAMGIDWMSRDGMREAIPPLFTELLGQQVMAYLAQERAA